MAVTKAKYENEKNFFKIYDAKLEGIASHLHFS